MSLWTGTSPLSGRIMLGVLGEKHATNAGMYRFTSTDARAPKLVQLIYPDADNEGGGDFHVPRPGTLCLVACTHDGGEGFVVGYCRPIRFDEDSDDAPSLEDEPETLTPGDKVDKTSGGATIMLKRAGSVIVEGASGCGSIRMNPEDQTTTFRSNNLVQSHEGYRAVRGRREVGTTRPATWSRQDYMHTAGGSHDRFRIEHGTLSSVPSTSPMARRRLSLGSVTVVGGQTSTVIKTRETYYSDGSWVGEGPKYQWGGSGANEPAVLGTQLVAAINDLINIIRGLTVNTAFGPSTPPIPPTTTELTRLSNELSGNILSTYLFFSKYPPVLGTE